MDQKLAQLASLGQKDKAPAYLALLADVLARPDTAATGRDLHTLLDAVVNQESTNLVVGRQVLSELVGALASGTSVPDLELRKQIVQDTLAIVQPRQNSYEEQVRAPRFRCAIIEVFTPSDLHRSMH
jgi:COP9 signalosome complex subunit 4